MKFDVLSLRSQFLQSSHPGTNIVHREKPLNLLTSYRKQCISCGDLIKATPTDSLRGGCRHDYCRGCINDLVEACTRDESLYPPRCCGQPFPYDALVALLGVKLRLTFDSKRTELDVPAENRVYCPTPSCSAFLGSSENATRNLICRKCLSLVCPMCKQLAHAGENCSENTATLEVRELARNEGWQTCPVCKAIIELHQGCYHMTCRCRAQFCYLCAVPWKNCSCPQWDEGRLLDTAQRRVGREVGDRARLAQPAVFAQQVQRMANTLRQNHDCDQHLWRKREGRARCEECQFTLPNFILVSSFHFPMTCGLNEYCLGL
jgi:IBR domain, a half RING-finger domain